MPVFITHLLMLSLIVPFAAPHPSTIRQDAVAALSPGTGPAQVAADWSEPAVIWPETWPDPLRFSVNDDGTRIVALIPHGGGDDNSRPIVVSEFSGGAWQEPAVIAQNGAYSEAPMQYLPQQTHPLISGDGSTIAYVGYTGSTFGVYVADHLGSGVWSTPALLNTGFANTHYWISLSRDGNTLAVSDYPFLGTQHLYVLTRQAGVWGAPVRVSLDSAPNPGGGMASLSEDGSKLTYIANAHVMFSEKIDGQWTLPQAVTDDDNLVYSAEYPQMSGDGRSIFYWLVTLVPDGSSNVRVAQNLYLARRASTTWGASQQVNGAPILPSFVTEGPAAADRRATRIVFTRPVTTTDPGDGHSYVYASHLEASEWTGNDWQEARLVAANGAGNYNKWPRLLPHGKTLIFDGGIRYAASSPPVYDALWQMRTDAAPAAPPLPTSTTGLIAPSGGSLFSEIDNTLYEFAAGTFTETVQFTHTVWSDPPPPPDGLVNISGIGGLGHAFAATAFSAGADQLLQPTRPVTVTVDYSNTGPGIAISGTLSLWWLNLGQWTQVPSFDDPLAGKVTATVDHFSQFAVFGETNRLFLPFVVRK